MLSSQLDIRISEKEYSPEPLAQEILADARLAAQVAMRQLDDAEPRRARMFISGLGEHALVALTQAPQGLTPQTEGWILGTLSDELRQFRTRVAKFIDPMMTLKGSSILTLGIRVCDEAYLLAHHLAYPAAKSEELPDLDEFRVMPESQRDDQIQALRNSRPWRRIMEGF